MELGSGVIVVKVGGSLFTLPDFNPRLRDWLGCLQRERRECGLVLVPGGGPTTDAIRTLDATLALGEERSHWLALRALTINAHVLAALLDADARVAVQPAPDALTLLDAYEFARADEGKPGCLPHSWSVTSDSVAARVAVVTNARELILLKAAAPPAEPIDWRQASRQGYVDPYFPEVLRHAPRSLRVRAVDLRTWQLEPLRENQPVGAPARH